MPGTDNLKEIAQPRTVGVLLMAYGSPEKIEDLEAYLLDIRSGRQLSPELLEEIRSRYLQIGGRSPLLDLTRAQAESLQAELEARSIDGKFQFMTAVGMRHWEPRILSAVENLAAAGASHIVGLVMAPHSSQMSTGAYYQKLHEAVETLDLPLEVIPVRTWHDRPGFIEAVAEKVEAALAEFRDEVPYVVMTAHSLPARILSMGDPYDAQLKETAQLLASRSGLPEGRWQFSYQSAGQTPEPWLGPAIEALIVDLAKAGEKNVLLVPIGFVSDHVEVLYDLDIACQKIASEHGVNLKRTESLNSSPRFIQTLGDIVLEAVTERFQPAGSPAAQAD